MPAGPPGGGFGVPPGGAPPGGYGAPPGGPGGYGAPPGPPGGAYGAPPGVPPGPPKKSGPNVGLIIGIGCGVLFLIGAVVAVILIFVVRDAASTVATPTTKPVSTSVSTTSPTPDPPAGEGKIELKDVRFFKSKSSAKTLYMVAEISNPGSSAVGFPRAKVTLYDAAKTAIGSSHCTTIVRILPGNETIPCHTSFFDVKDWKTYKTELSTTRMFAGTRLADLKASDIKYAGPKRYYQPHTLTGKITNSGSVKAKSVWAIVGLYDEGNKIAGAGSAAVAGNDLEAGASGTFKVSIYNVAAPVTRYVVTPVGYEE